MTRGSFIRKREKKFIFFPLPWNKFSIFPFHVMPKRLLSFWCFWHFLSNSDILISLSLFKFFVCSSSDWNQWLTSALWAALAKQGWHARWWMSSEFAPVSWREGGLEGMPRVGWKVRRYEELSLGVFSSCRCRCYYHSPLEEQTKGSPRWNK